MQFKKYNSIENHHNNKPIMHIHEMGLSAPDVKWVIREKIHGANFSFWYDGTTLKCARRSGFLQLHENFYNYQLILENLRDNIKEMYDYFIDIDVLEDGELMVLYGELAGQSEGFKSVQREVHYGDLDFYLFDIVANDKFIDDGFVTHARQLFDFTEAPVLAIGEFDVLCKTINNFDSLYHLGKPGIEDVINPVELVSGEKNIAEGYVLKPVVPRFFGNGSRVIIKCKSEAFQEKSGKSKNDMTGLKQILNELDIEILSDTLQYVTEPRLRNVLSKRLEIKDHKEFGSILQDLFDDVIEDATRDNVLNRPIENPTEIYKQLKNTCAILIRKNLQSILSHTF